LEGEFRPGELMMEGPKPEWYGFASGPRGPAYAMRVHCVTYRPNPILPTIAHVSSSMTDLEATFTVTIPPSINAFCRMTGLPIKQGNITGSKWSGYARDLYERILAMPGFHIYADEVRLVDDDVNIARPEMVIDALYNQRNPARDMWFTDRETPTGVLYRVYWEREDFQRESAFMSALSAGIASNCLTKGDPPLGVRRCGFETLLPEETQKWVMDNWQKMGFKEEPYWNKAYEEMKPLL
jgi:hypothetical protein